MSSFSTYGQDRILGSKQCQIVYKSWNLTLNIQQCLSDSRTLKSQMNHLLVKETPKLVETKNLIPKNASYEVQLLYMVPNIAMPCKYTCWFALVLLKRSFF